MASVQHLNNDSTVIDIKDEPFRLHSYQTEMVEESLKENIIVAMDTGSGKTHIAIARTEAALETCGPDQFVWFLAPTVTLCEQQYRLFCKHLPAFGARFLSGSDNVDHWTEKSVWDAVLNNIQIVVSTHQVLLDALHHAFVKIGSLALLIFDEAHHCIENHPANLIMRHFYRPLISGSGSSALPRILGLSASPVISTKVRGLNGLQTIEENMHAITRTPKTCRSDLIRHVHRPELVKAIYPLANAESLRYPDILSSLKRVHEAYDIVQDPYVVDLMNRRNNGKDVGKEWRKFSVKQKTYCGDQLKLLVTKGEGILQELGGYAAEWYLQQCISQYKSLMQRTDHALALWSDGEKQHLRNLLQEVCIAAEQASSLLPLQNMTPKVESLINLLIAEWTESFTGIIFVEQRAWVAALAQILTLHPETRHIFNIGTFVGTSSSMKRKANIADFAEPQNQQETLDDFRAGKKNLIIATSVLEEGIDVSSCHLVVCFEPPKNLKSFIQRRGRARKEKSKYIILLPSSGSSLTSQDTWQALEDEMKKAYLDNLREVKLAEERESIAEKSFFQYRVPSTGALLTLDNAYSHLSHFCATLRSGPYVDSRPEFTFDKNGCGEITAKVDLPISVDPSVRTARSSQAWRSERMAKNDAAFQAYTALHSAGLLNDHLLPLANKKDDGPESNVSDDLASLLEVMPQLNPWLGIAKQQEMTPTEYHRVLLSLQADGREIVSMVLLTPCQLPALPPVLLHWNKDRQYAIVTSSLPSTTLADHELAIMRLITLRLLKSVFSSSHIDAEATDYLWLFVPSFTEDLWTPQKLEEWYASTEGVQSASEVARAVESNNVAIADVGLVYKMLETRSFTLENIVSQASRPLEIDESGITLELVRMPKRRDFLHRIPQTNTDNEAYTAIYRLNAEECEVSRLPSTYSIFSLFIPSILHRFEISMVAEHLQRTVLAPVTTNSNCLDLTVSAITSSSANEDVNYQRLEFLGDCLLKLITSIHLMAANPKWPEGYLTSRKGQITSNGYLARATIAAGLDEYIIRKGFTGLKWRPQYASEIFEGQQNVQKIKISSKIVADVIESLIGASYIEEGLGNAFTCIKTLLPSEPWTPLHEASVSLFDTAPSEPFATHFSIIEKLFNYVFEKKALLLEALTHASFNGPHAVASYERLEFLGDAVLDFIIVKRLFAQAPELSHQAMHSIRTAMVNASFLGFRMFETTLHEERTKVTVDFRTKEPIQQSEVVDRALWQFMRHSSGAIADLQIAAVERHKKWRREILNALEHEHRYPWHLLARTDADKLLSDIVESVIGAIYIDSKGDISACERFVKKLGISDCLERVLRDEIDCLHPKERLGHLAVDKTVEYVNHGSDEANNYRCQVKVDGQEIGGVFGGLKKLNAQTEAAWRAVRILEGVDDVKMDDNLDMEKDQEESSAGVPSGLKRDFAQLG